MTASLLLLFNHQLHAVVSVSVYWLLSNEPITIGHSARVVKEALTSNNNAVIFNNK
ncbi:unnamed protein product, partial [Ceratitis capitata]